LSNSVGQARTSAAGEDAFRIRESIFKLFWVRSPIDRGLIEP